MYKLVFTVVCLYVLRIQMNEVVRMAIMVPTGMDLWASLRSPDLLEPAMIPEISHTHTHTPKRQSALEEVLWPFTSTVYLSLF